jgi:hypothetical protein
LVRIYPNLIEPDVTSHPNGKHHFTIEVGTNWARLETYENGKF